MEIQRKPIIIAGKPGGWSKGTKVTGAKGFVFLAGTVGRDLNTGEIPRSAGEQTKLILKSIKTDLEEYGSSLKNILHMWIYVKGEFTNGIKFDPKFAEIDKVMEAFWKENCPEFLKENKPPASTLLGVTSLARPGLELEITAIAAIG